MQVSSFKTAVETDIVLAKIIANASEGDKIYHQDEPPGVKKVHASPKRSFLDSIKQFLPRPQYR